MKARVIQSRFWDDEFVSECNIFTQHLYIYLLTSQYINISGVFQLPSKKIMMEASLTPEMFDSAKKELDENDKVKFYKGWIYVKNAMKNNNYVKSTSNLNAYYNELLKIPSEVYKYFDIKKYAPVDTTVDTSVKTSPYTNKKQEIRIQELMNQLGKKVKSL